MTEGKEIPDNTLVLGSPGKPVRELDEKAVEMLRWSASHYVENARRFADGLRRIDPEEEGVGADLRRLPRPGSETGRVGTDRGLNS